MSINPQEGTREIYTGWLVVEVCCSCGIAFAMPQDFKDACLRRRGVATGKGFFCPNGHQQWYTGQTEADLMREQRDRAQAERDEWKRATKHEQDRVRAVKGVLTKIKKRISCGVCPCCNRSFENLARHIANQHPEFKKKAHK